MLKLHSVLGLFKSENPGNFKGFFYTLGIEDKIKYIFLLFLSNTNRIEIGKKGLYLSECCFCACTKVCTGDWFVLLINWVGFFSSAQASHFSHLSDSEVDNQVKVRNCKGDKEATPFVGTSDQIKTILQMAKKILKYMNMNRNEHEQNN